MEVNAVVALLKSHQFEKAQERIQKAGSDCHQALIGLRVYFLIKDKKYQEALAAVQSMNTKYAVFIRVHIFQQMRESERAVDTLLEDLETWIIDRIPNEYLLMLFKSMITLKQAERLSQIVEKCSKTVSAEVLLAYVDMIKTWKMNTRLPSVVESLLVHLPKDKQIQALYLEVFSDVDLNKATRLQQSLIQPAEDQNQEEYIQRLLDEGMPEKRKVKRTADAEMEQTEGGAEIFIPKKRNRKIKYPKGFDPKNPG